jgi:hypothetical protein
MGSGNPSDRENELGDGVYVVPSRYIGDYDNYDCVSHIYVVKGRPEIDYGVVEDPNGHQIALTRNLTDLHFEWYQTRNPVREQSERIASSSTSFSSSAPPLPPFAQHGVPLPTDSEGKVNYRIF